MHEHLRQKPPFFSPLGVVFTNTGSGSLGFSAFAFFSFLAPPSALLPFRPHYVVTLQRDTIYRFHLFLLTHLGFAFFCLASFFSWLLVSSLGAPSAGAGAVSTGFCVSEDCASGVVLCGSMRCLTHYLSIEINNRGIQINTGERTAKVENRRNHPDFWMKRQRLPK